MDLDLDQIIATHDIAARERHAAQWEQWRETFELRVTETWAVVQNAAEWLGVEPASLVVTRSPGHSGINVELVRLEDGKMLLLRFWSLQGTGNGYGYQGCVTTDPDTAMSDDPLSMTVHDAGQLRLIMAWRLGARLRWCPPLDTEQRHWGHYVEPAINSGGRLMVRVGDSAMNVETADIVIEKPTPTEPVQEDAA